MKVGISSHKHLPREAMHETRWIFIKKMKKCPNHGFVERHIKSSFYRSLNYVIKHVVDALFGGLFMRKTFSNRMQLLDEITRTTGLGTLEMQR